MAECSCLGCKYEAKRMIELEGKSPFDEQKYIITVLVCQEHYDKQKSAGAIITNKPIPYHIRAKQGKVSG